MKMYICKLCTAKIDFVLVQPKFCIIIVQKPITAFAPQQDSALYPDAVSPSDPHYFFRSATPVCLELCG